jgi:hypothetical protein
MAVLSYSSALSSIQYTVHHVAIGICIPSKYRCAVGAASAWYTVINHYIVPRTVLEEPSEHTYVYSTALQHRSQYTSEYYGCTSCGE